MARQSINTGATANDGTGDTLRQAGAKINQNFEELYSLYGGDSIDAAGFPALTDSGIDFIEGVYRVKVGVETLTAKRTADFPDASGTIVIDAATQTLTNKTLTTPRLNAPQIQDLKIFDADSSNVYQIIPGSLTSTHNINIPSLTDSDTFVLAATTQNLTNKTITTPTIVNAIIHGHLRDSADADVIHFNSVASAVNHLDISNAATGGNPLISVEGDDSDVNLDLSGVGTGAVEFTSKIAYEPTNVTSDGTVATNSHSLIICNKGSTLALTLANGTVPGEVKIFTNKGAGAAQITPTSFVQGTRVDVNQYGAANFIWDGSNWYLTGYSRDSDVTIQA